MIHSRQSGRESAIERANWIIYNVLVHFCPAERAHTEMAGENEWWQRWELDTIELLPAELRKCFRV